jgi:hypothetical protein
MNSSRLAKVAACLLCAAALVVVLLVGRKWLELDRAADRIVEQYPEQIAAITQFAIDLPRSSARRQNPEALKAAREKLNQLFADDAFVFVSLTNPRSREGDDIKRGIRPGDGFWHIPFAEGAAPSHQVYLGSSPSDELYYVYHAVVPEARHFREFQIWIRRSAVDSP